MKLINQEEKCNEIKSENKTKANFIRCIENHRGVEEEEHPLHKSI